MKEKIGKRCLIVVLAIHAVKRGAVLLIEFSITPHIPLSLHVLLSLSIDIATCPVTVSSVWGFVVCGSSKQHQSVLTLSKDFSNHPHIYKIIFHMGSLINGIRLGKQTKSSPSGRFKTFSR